MNQQLEVLALAVRRLEALGIPYIVTGSIALSAYATPRMTRDIDIVIDASEDQAAAIAVEFAKDSYADPDVARAAAATGGMFNVIHDATLMKLDFIIPRRDEFRDAAFARANRFNIEGVSASVISPEDLILSKLLWRQATNSPQQATDIRTLLGSGRAFDWVYLDQWSRQLGIAADLAEFRR